MPSDEPLVLFLTCLVCRGPGSNTWPPVPRSGHSTTWATGAGKKKCKLMVLIHVCFIYNTAIFFTLTKSVKTHGQKLEHWQNYNNSNGKLALKHIVPFTTENDDCRILSPCSRTMTMIFNLFSTSRLSHRKKKKKYIYIYIYIRKSIILSHFTFHLVWSTQRISKIFSAYTKTYSFYRAVRMLTSEWGNRIFFSIFICFGVGARETRLSDNMTLGWKNGTIS